MKKTMSILLAVMIVLSCSIIAGAESSLSNTKAYFDTDSNSIVSSGVSTYGEGHIVTVKIMLGDEVKYFNFAKTGTNGKFEFKYTLDPFSDDSGTYCVTFGGAGIDAVDADDDIVFVNHDETVRILEIINKSTYDTIENNIASENEYIDVELDGDITKLTHPEKVFNRLADDDYTSIIELRAAFDAAVAVQTFNEADASTASELLEKYEDTLKLDLDGIFSEVKTEELKNDIYEKICGEEIKLTVKEFSKSFNKAIYTSLFNGLSSENREELIPYIEACNKAGYTDISMQKYNGMENADRINLIKAVIDRKNSSKFSNLDDVARVFEEETNELIAEKEEEDDDTPTRGGGGGGGIGIKIQTSADITSGENNEPIIPETKRFTDLDNVEWAANQIEYLASKGIVNGKGNGIYDPNGNITREEFIKILMSSLDLPSEITNNIFVDVAEGQWFYEPVMKAYALGIVNGVDFDVFGTGMTITREQLCTMIYRAVLLLDAEIQVNNVEVSIPDSEEIAEYALPAVESMYRAGIVSGMGDGTFNPRGYATRAQAAKIIYGVLERIGRL